MAAVSLLPHDSLYQSYKESCIFRGFFIFLAIIALLRFYEMLLFPAMIRLLANLPFGNSIPFFFPLLFLSFFFLFPFSSLNNILVSLSRLMLILVVTFFHLYLFDTLSVFLPKCRRCFWRSLSRILLLEG